MLKLRSKPCTIGRAINTRTQMHGEEPNPYMDIPVSFLVTQKELNSIMQEPLCAASWFNTDADDSEPLLKDIAPYKLKAKFENSLAKLIVGVNSVEIDFGNCTLNKIAFAPQQGGKTLVSLKIQAAITSKTNGVFLWMAKTADVVLQFGEMLGDDAQEELDLDADDEGKEDGEGETVRMGRTDLHVN